jgi:hypothetical protein
MKKNIFSTREGEWFHRLEEIELPRNENMPEKNRVRLRIAQVVLSKGHQFCHWIQFGSMCQLHLVFSFYFTPNELISGEVFCVRWIFLLGHASMFISHVLPGD